MKTTRKNIVDFAINQHIDSADNVCARLDALIEQREQYSDRAWKKAIKVQTDRIARLRRAHNELTDLLKK